MRVFKEIPSWINFRSNIKSSLGFVPTMGALHDGHMSLIKRSLSENKNTLVSIFLNPTQFNNAKDLEAYPSEINEDIKKLESLNNDDLYLITPRYEAIYPDNYTYKVIESQLSKKLCGSARPGHFDGVLTVVLKLLNIANADTAYFGEKDYQQYLLIKKMTEAFFHKTKIISCPTVRENSGLAMSSRNNLLNQNHKELAPELYDSISNIDDLDEAKRKLKNLGFKIDYLEEHFDRRFVAAFLDDVRLIDNVER